VTSGQSEDFLAGLRTLAPFQRQETTSLKFYATIKFSARQHNGFTQFMRMEDNEDQRPQLLLHRDRATFAENVILWLIL
jgi:hypothetical protein